MIRNIFKTIFILVGCIAITTGCVTTGNQNIEPNTDVLRVGVSPHYPPIIYKSNGKIIGVEADLAKALAITMNKKVEFVETKWNKLIPDLNSGKFDIIMSGMSITLPRNMQISFTEPYLRNGLMTAVPIEAISKFRTPADILFFRGKVGVVKNTTGEEFVRRFMINAQVVTLKKSSEAAHFFETGRIKMFINDSYAIAWLITQHETTLAGIWTPLTNDYFAWGISRGNPQLLKKVNKILKQWKTNSSLDKMLDTWLPLRKNIQWNNNQNQADKQSGNGILGY